METVTISKKEYELLKRNATVDNELVQSIKKSLKDIKEGRISEWTPSK
ncbi:MAG: hypothetical protein NUV57_02215 [archaeon]|nr:hypothetical protein [archaeon]